MEDREAKAPEAAATRESTSARSLILWESQVPELFGEVDTGSVGENNIGSVEVGVVGARSRDEHSFGLGTFRRGSNMD